ncbi:MULTISPECIES: hypothetical protein [unclassified Streptomyces]|uniref:hypothetical protein n=1 Tax=unclassified Streptomyces TaxID=2593676 RepID=UPI00364BD595
MSDEDLDTTTMDDLLKPGGREAALARYNQESGTPGGGTLSLLTLTVEREEGPSQVRQLDSPEALADTKTNAVVLPEGCHFRVEIGVRVDGGSVDGVMYTSTQYRKGVKVTQDKQMLGTLRAQTTTQSLLFPRHGWEDAPSGLGLGSYDLKAQFHNDEGKLLAEFRYALTFKQRDQVPSA